MTYSKREADDDMTLLVFAWRNVGVTVFLLLLFPLLTVLACRRARSSSCFELREFFVVVCAPLYGQCQSDVIWCGGFRLYWHSTQLIALEMTCARSAIQDMIQRLQRFIHSFLLACLASGWMFQFLRQRHGPGFDPTCTSEVAKLRHSLCKRNKIP